MNFFKWLFRRKPKKKLVLGLALGSGGAKGFAELGALKAFEENHLEFDVIAGTSIGSIIGAFYAAGYSVTDIENLLKKVDVNDIKNFFMIRMDTAGLFRVIDENIGSLNIEELKKPFRAVATDLDTGEEKVFDSGKVATALCASSSYPPFFKPVIIGDKRYIDGAFCNSIPADLVRAMGADYVVSIDLATHQARRGVLSYIFPTFKGKTDTPWDKGYLNSNIVIHPSLSAFKATSFSQKDAMFDIGYSAALQVIPKIKAELSAKSVIKK